MELNCGGLAVRAGHKWTAHEQVPEQSSDFGTKEACTVYDKTFEGENFRGLDRKW